MSPRYRVLTGLALICLTVSFLFPTIPASSQEAIRLVVNGRLIQPEVPPIIINDRTMVPLRFVAEALGAQVDWQAESQTVSVTASLPQAGGADVVSVVRRIMPSVVGVLKVGSGDLGSGTGVIISADGYILTNHHVIEGANTIHVILDGRPKNARLIGSDSSADLAVIKVEATGLAPAVWGDSESLQVGELAVAIGNPLGFEYQSSVTAGIISGLKRRVKDEEGEFAYSLIQTDAAINRGNSGGPLVNSKGEVIGINTLKIAAETEGLGFAIPSRLAKNVADHLIRYGKVKRPWLGVELRENRYSGIAILLSEGITVEKLVANGPAHLAGIQPGDVITRIGQYPVRRVVDLRDALSVFTVGDSLDVELKRNGQLVSVTVTLQERT